MSAPATSAYCMKCKKDTPNKDGSVEVKPMPHRPTCLRQTSVCSVCGSKKSKFVGGSPKAEEAAPAAPVVEKTPKKSKKSNKVKA